jgi:transposase
MDYHVEFDGFFYSVPHGLIRQQVDVRATSRTIEIFHHGKRVAAHQRRYTGRRHGTDPAPMPSAHRRDADWTPDRFRRRAASSSRCHVFNCPDVIPSSAERLA